MKKKGHITAFYLETLLMIVVFVSIILVLTRVFGSARAQSAKAKHLTAAVTLAQSTAEAVSAAGSPQDLHQLLNVEENALLQEDASTGEALVTAVYDGDMNPVPISGEILQAAQQDAESKAGFSQTGQAGQTGQTGQTRAGSAPEAARAAGDSGETETAGTDLASGLLRAGDLIVETAWNPAGDRDTALSKEEGASAAPLLQTEETGTDAEMVKAVITVFDGNTGEALFSVQTAVYLSGK